MFDGDLDEQVQRSPPGVVQLDVLDRTLHQARSSHDPHAVVVAEVLDAESQLHRPLRIDLAAGKRWDDCSAFSLKCLVSYPRVQFPETI